MMSEATTLAGPLTGRRIVVTRAQAQAGDLVAQLMALGATPLECPAIAIAPPESYDGLDAALDRISGYDWIIFTSVNGVAAVLARLSDRGQDRAVLHGVRIGAIGPATAQALAAAGVPPQFVPATYVAEAIVAQIADVAGQHILLPRADIARAALGAGLRGRGALVDEVTAYRTVSAPGLAAIADLLRVGSVDALTFTSSSTVRFFLEGLAVSGITPADLQREPGRPAVICIGPITAGTAQAQGLVVDAVAEEYTTGGLIAALLRWFAAADPVRSD